MQARSAIKRGATPRGYIQGTAHDVITRARDEGFQRVIGTSGTIRTLGEAVLLASGGAALRSVNAQLITRKALKELANGSRRAGAGSGHP